MTFIIADRVKETTTSVGTSDITLAGAMTGFKTFASRCAVGDTLYYAIQGVDGTGTPTAEWECGLGTYSSANTLTRTTVTASSNADTAVNFSAGTKQVYITMPAVQVAWVREKLTADRTYYVRTDGNDSNTGLVNTAGGAFLTIQKAVDVVLDRLDLGVYDITIQVADGTYTGTVLVTGPWAGSGKVTINGNSSTPSNVLISTTASQCVSVTGGARITVKDLKLVSTGSFLLAAAYAGKIEFSGVNFGSCASQQIRASDGGAILCSGNYTISAGASIHLSSVSCGVIRVQNVTVTLTGVPNFSGAYVDQNLASSTLVNGCTFSGTATGKRYNLIGNGVCNAGGVTTYLPGDVAGTTSTGGQYV